MAIDFTKEGCEYVEVERFEIIGPVVWSVVFSPEEIKVISSMLIHARFRPDKMVEVS